MADTWLLIGLMIVTTLAIRASGPVLLGGRRLPDRFNSVIVLVAPALLAALVVTQTLQGESGGDLTVDERVLGVAAAGGVVALRGSVLVAMAAAMIVTAGARALT